MSHPLISILVPVYNGEKYIGRCVTSLLNQTYTNLDILIYDDCSTDSTRGIVEAICDSRVRIISSTTNEKHQVSWNKMLQESRGEYTKVLCADDILDHSCIEKSYLALKDSPEKIMSFTYRLFIDEKDHEISLPKPKRSLFAGNSSLEIIRKGLLTGTNTIGEPNCVLFRSEAIKKGIKFNFDIYWMVDPDFFIQLAALGGFVLVPEKLSGFRISTSSWSVLNSAGQAKFFIKYIRQKHIQNIFNFSKLELMLAAFNAYKLQYLRKLVYIYLILIRKHIRK